MEVFNEAVRIAALQHRRKMSAHAAEQLGLFRSLQGIWASLTNWIMLIGC